jgi:hypothetical protein
MKFWFGGNSKNKGTAGNATDTAAAAAATPTAAAASGTPASAATDTGTPATSGASTTSTASSSTASAATAPPAPPAPPTPPDPPAKPSASMLSVMSGRLLDQASAPLPRTSALNDQIVQAVQLSNAENAAYAPSQIAIGPNMMISQASGLIAQSSAAYFDGVSKLALASQSILLKQMTQNLVENNLEGAAEDALGVLATDILLGAAAAVAAAAGALEAESASFAIDKIDQSIAKYSDVMRSRKATVN